MASKIMELLNKHNIPRGTDTTTREAEAAAHKFIQTMDLEDGHPVELHVDRFDGLVIISDPESQTPGVHFRSALCGYEGSGTQVSAKIMKLFGFDDYTLHEVEQMINTGGDHAQFSFDLMRAVRI